MQNELNQIKDETFNPNATEQELRLEIASTSGFDQVRAAEKLVALKRTVVDQRIVSLSVAYREYYDVLMEMFTIINKTEKP